MAQAEFRAEVADWPPSEIDRYIARHYPAYWLKVDLPQQDRPRASSCAPPSRRASRSPPMCGSTPSRGVTVVTVLAPDHPRLLSVIAGACAVTGANIVDAQIYTTTDGMALDTIAITREFPATRTRSAAPTASPPRSRTRCAATCGCPTWWRSARRPKGASGPSRSSPRSPSTINGRTATPSSRSAASTGRACSTSSPRRCRSSTSTSPRPMSRPSASAPSTCSTSPTSWARRSPRRPATPRSSAR